jgi:hypothetical protein
MRVFSFYIPQGGRPEKYRGEVIARLSRMLDAAEREGVKLAMKTRRASTGNTGDRCLVSWRSWATAGN